MNLKNIYNEAARRCSALRELSPEESSLAKETLVDMYKDLAALCHDNDLMLMLGGGSCLGAVRVQDFIPWDDDLDISMPRESYTRLIDLLRQGKMSDKYEFACPGMEKDAPCGFLKLYRRGTRWVEVGREYSPYPKGIFIDIFPIDGAPRNKFIRVVKGFVADTLRMISGCVHSAWTKDSEAQKALLRCSVKTELIFKCRKFVGRVFSVIPHRMWLRLYDWFVADNNMTGLVTLPAGRNHYLGEVLPSDVFFPPTKGKFHGIDVFLPCDCEKYLSNLYGPDYMTPVSEEAREHHFLVDVKL